MFDPGPEFIQLPTKIGQFSLASVVKPLRFDGCRIGGGA